MPENMEDAEQNHRLTWTQSVGAIAASLGSAACGVTGAYSSEAIPQLMIDPELKMDLQLCSWFGKV